MFSPITDYRLRITDYRLPITEKGFTLVELLVTIVIVSILASVGLGAAAGARRNADDTRRQTDLRKIESALQQYYADQGHYPMCLSPDVMSQLDNCTGNVIDSGQAADPHNCTNNYRGSCTVTRVYLNPFPHDPYDNGAAIHYCYAGYQNFQAGNSPTAGLCYGGSGTNPQLCQYFKLYSPESNSSVAPITCHDWRGDHTQMRYLLDSLGN